MCIRNVTFGYRFSLRLNVYLIYILRVKSKLVKLSDEDHAKLEWLAIRRGSDNLNEIIRICVREVYQREIDLIMARNQDLNRGARVQLTGVQQ